MITTPLSFTQGNKTCIIIAGPTAVGKTNFAIQLAQHLGTEIISADSRQCFKELHIGVAKPSAAELNTVTHHFIGSHSIHEEMNAGIFEQYALEKVTSIFAKHDIAVMVGGTGLYIKAFCEGIDEMPAIDPSLRDEIITAFKTNGLNWLQQQVKENDPVYYENGEIHNPQRLMRALEIKLFSGRSIIEFQTQQKKRRDFNIVKLGLELPREVLYNNINTRVDLMMKEGLLQEVKSLLPLKTLNALQTVGYKELFSFFEGTVNIEEAVEQIKINTRHYAKRQMTWFKKDSQWNWVRPLHPVSPLLEEILLGK
jgi:tRNA dimethylallyltransferase